MFIAILTFIQILILNIFFNYLIICDPNFVLQYFQLKFFNSYYFFNFFLIHFIILQILLIQQFITIFCFDLIFQLISQTLDLYNLINFSILIVIIILFFLNFLVQLFVFFKNQLKIYFDFHYIHYIHLIHEFYCYLIFSKFQLFIINQIIYLLDNIIDNFLRFCFENFYP